MEGDVPPVTVSGLADGAGMSQLGRIEGNVYGNGGRGPGRRRRSFCTLRTIFKSPPKQAV